MIVKNGKPRTLEGANWAARQNIMPLLKKYNATAKFAGHEHFYERSEPEDGVSMIVAVGSKLRNRDPQATKDNPHSKVYAKTNNYCIIKVMKEKCEMQVFDLDGKIIDTRVWKPRKNVKISK